MGHSLKKSKTARWVGKTTKPSRDLAGQVVGPFAVIPKGIYSLLKSRPGRYGLIGGSLISLGLSGRDDPAKGVAEVDIGPEIQGASNPSEYFGRAEAIQGELSSLERSVGGNYFPGLEQATNFLNMFPGLDYIFTTSGERNADRLDAINKAQGTIDSSLVEITQSMGEGNGEKVIQAQNEITGLEFGQILNASNDVLGAYASQPELAALGTIGVGGYIILQYLVMKKKHKSRRRKKDGVAKKVEAGLKTVEEANIGQRVEDFTQSAARTAGNAIATFRKSYRGEENSSRN